MTTLTITVDDADLRAAFARLAQLGADMTPIMKKAAGHLADAAEQAFEREASPSGVPWVDLKASTRRARAKRGHWPGKKLRVTGQLSSSVTPSFGPDFAQIGSNEPYARIQQVGGTIHRTHIRSRQTIGEHDITIPARPFLGLSPEAQEAILADVQAALADAFNG
jgi:phage virion morphogenesis protein